MEAKTKTPREPVQVVPGHAIVLAKTGQVNGRLTQCGLSSEEATRKATAASRDGQVRYVIEIASVTECNMGEPRSFGAE